MDLFRRFRGATVALAMLVTVVTGSQIVDLRQLANEVGGFSLTPAGDDVARLSPITVTFATSPLEKDPASLLQLLPTTPGSYAWLSRRTLLFQPDFPGLARGTQYTALVPARPDAGLPQTVAKKFTVTGKLTVQQIIPGDGDTEVPLGAQILVQFSRSVAPLTTLANQPKDTVVTFDPPLHGTGEWLNTSIYRFIPSDLKATQKYDVKIARGLSSAVDGVLESDVRSTFTTIGPSVDQIVPDGNWLYGGPWQEAVVTFNQPMAESAADGVTVRADGGALVPGTRTWNAAHTVLTFNPTQRMTNQTKYFISVDKGLRGARGGETAKVRTSSFTTVGAPSVKQTFPANGATDAGRYGLSIQFSTPMDPDSLEGKVSISGFTARDLEGRVSTNEFAVGVGIQLEGSTTYTVTLAPGAKDRYGQLMGGHRFSFTTGELPSSVALALPGYGGAATYSASAEPFLWFQTTNKSSVGFTLYPLTADEAKATMHNYGFSQSWSPSQKPLREWTQRIAAGKDQALLSRTTLSGGGPLPKGFYYLTTDGQYGSRFVFAVVDTVIVTKMSNDEVLAWALDHDTGKPVGGLTIHADGAVIQSADAVTDANGLATFATPKPVPGAVNDRGYWITAGSPGGERLAAVSSRWQSVSPYQFGLPVSYYATAWVGHVYTDRPIYRPGEAVLYKGIIRADDDAHYTLPPQDGPFEFVLRNSRGQDLQRTDVRLNGFGSFEGSFALPADAPTGDYYLAIQLKDTAVSSGPKGGSSGFQIAASSFAVSAFRKPEFEAAIVAAKTSYTSGDLIEASANASFFFGGALAGATVDWTAIADAYVPQAKGFESYTFTDYDYARQAVAQAPIRGKGTAVTGTDGTARITLPAVLNAAEGAQRFTLSANVTDQNGQAVAASTQLTVYPASVSVGLRSDRWVATVGEDATLKLAAVDTAGAVVPDQRVTVKVYDRQWLTTKVLIPGGGRRYQSDARDTLLATLTATTDIKGVANAVYRPMKSGQLRIVAEVTDAKGRTARASTFLWASGYGFALWQVTNDDTIKLVADRERYEVGDTAEVLVPAPFAGATALVTIERGKIITREVRILPTNNERLRIPIVDRSVPNVFVSVVLYRAPTAADPLPRYKVGYTELPVSTKTRQLNVKITPNTPQAQPGQTVKYDIKVTDSDGKGVRSEVSIAVVDKAVLSLAEERGVDGIRAFWFERGLAVTTVSSMGNSIDRWNDVIAELPKIGKGGSGSGLTNQRLREAFRNTAYWEAQLTTNDDGTATVSVRMPDDLTTWRMQARAISGDTMVGEGTNELVSTQPLLIRSALPRFLRVGDTADLRVLVRNATHASASVAVTLKAEGVDVSGPLTLTRTIGPDESVSYVWPAKVRAEGEVKLTVTADGGEIADAMTVTLPAYLDVTPETMSTGGIVTKQAGYEAVYLPKFADTKTGSLAVSVRSSLVGSLAGELASFGPFPEGRNENAELVASRLIGTIGVARAEKAAGGNHSYAARIASDLAGLVGRQRPDGGWAWCDAAECTTDPNVTGWVLLALGEARRDGLAIDDGVSSRAGQYVFSWVNRQNTTLESATGDQDQKAFLLAALAASGGRGVWTVANALFEQDRARLSSWGRAYLINAFIDGGGKVEDEPVRILLSDLAASTLPSANGNHWENTSADPYKGSWMTSTGTTALVALAFARTRPDHQLLAQSVRWLVVARDAQGWHTNIERAMGILALSTYAVTAGELGADFAYKVLLDDTQVLAGAVKPSTTPKIDATRVSLSSITPGKTSIVAVQREFARTGRLYYTLDLRYTTPAQNVEAVNRGFAVSHSYSLLGKGSTPITSAKLGDTIVVTVTVIAPADRTYVTIEDLLPAGLEAVDTRLKTTDPALRAKLDADRTSATTRSANGYMAPWFAWYYSPWQQVDTRDDRTVLKTDRLPRGVYEYTYFARATTTGTFFVAPAHAQEAYFPEVFGRSDSAHFTVAQ